MHYNRLDQKWRLWAKTSLNTEDSRYHPLLCHMLDVAAVASFAWDQYLPQRIRKRLETALGIAEGRTLVAFLAGAHDIGKASPGFQKRMPSIKQLLHLPFSDNDQNRPHGFISAQVVHKYLGNCDASLLLSQIAGGHHGIFPRSMELRLGRDVLGNNDWKKVRHNILTDFARIAGLNLDSVIKRKIEITDPFIVPVLAGFISVVDWIGSNQEFFPCVVDYTKTVEIDAAKYWQKAQEQARNALEMLGWLPTVHFAEESPFDVIFSGFAANTLQKTAIELSSKHVSPYLMIIEAPMGHGKTEAALYAADLAMCRGFARGMYIAMPTQATGNAMFKRVLDDYLRRRGHQGKLNVQLVHGDALLAQMAEVPEGELSEFKTNNVAQDETNGDLEAQSWFTARKRTLLSPFGVGTIDQSLLSILQTKHWFVRLFGLTEKVVIFDEVHAYDAYMSTILERLLHWLAELDCTVILLSATLPKSKRKALAKAYSGRDDAGYKCYPRITAAKPRHYPNEQTEEMPICENIPMGDNRTMSLQFEKTDIESLTKTLTQKLAKGGCAAVICNTVDRSIEIYKYLRDNLKDTECLLFHARTLRMWRREREEEVLRRFGKGEKQADGTYGNLHRPNRAVLVATQVIEQSLDLDFDLMISEIAPIDLLLQRSGRLHRHPRERPRGLESPQFVVLCDADTNGGPPESFGKSIEFVYDRYILLRTCLALRGRNNIAIPSEVEALVETVYGSDCSDRDTAWLGALQEAQQNMIFEQSESRKASCRLLVSKVKAPCDLIEQFNDQLTDDEDPEVHKTVRAATREGDPSVMVVMLSADEHLADKPGISEIRQLLDKSAKLSHRGIFNAFLKDGDSPREWATNAHLRHAYLIRLDQQNRGLCGNYVLTLDERLGVMFYKESLNNG